MKFWSQHYVKMTRKYCGKIEDLFYVQDYADETSGVVIKKQ